MRDMPGGPEPSNLPPEVDPANRARLHMQTPLPKRFYKDVSVSAQGNAFVVQLDGRPVRTPGKALLSMPTAEAAALVAVEFAAQGETVNPVTMPVYRLANSALDGVTADPRAVVEDIVRYAGTDLVCYRADWPAGLVERQNASWDPVVAWARSTLGAPLYLAQGVIHVEQPSASIAAIAAHLASRTEPLHLAALHVMTTLTGSALLALAVEAGRLSVDEAWSAAHIDEDWQIEHWGQDSEAVARRLARKRDLDAAAALIQALRR